MRILLLIGICAVVAAIYAAGCGKMKPARMEISEAKPASRPRAVQIDHAGSVTESLQRKRTVLQALGRDDNSSYRSKDFRAELPSVSEEIAGRIDSAFAEWEEHRDYLISAQRKRAVSGVDPAKSNAEPAATPDMPAEQRVEHSIACLNWRMRIALLESRLAAAGESERNMLSAKLEQAKASLEAAHSECREETKASSGNAVEANPAAQDETNHGAGEKAAVSHEDRASETHRISSTLNGLRSGIKQKQVISTRNDPGHNEASWNTKHQDRLTGTQNSIDRAIMLLQQGKTLDEPDRLVAGSR